MAPFNFVSTRSADKKVFTAMITKSVPDQNEQFIASDLSNVLAMVAVSASGEVVTHKHNAQALKPVDFDSSVESLAKSAIEMSEEFDSDPSYDRNYRVNADARLVGNEAITFAMELYEVN